MGGSNGGLLMGAVLTQRPDLFRAVVSFVGIYDMLRVELDPTVLSTSPNTVRSKIPSSLRRCMPTRPITMFKTVPTIRQCCF